MLFMKKYFLTENDRLENKKEIEDLLTNLEMSTLVGGFETPYDRTYANTTGVGTNKPLPPVLK